MTGSIERPAKLDHAAAVGDLHVRAWQAAQVHAIYLAPEAWSRGLGSALLHRPSTPAGSFRYSVE